MPDPLSKERINETDTRAHNVLMYYAKHPAYGGWDKRDAEVVRALIADRERLEKAVFNIAVGCGVDRQNVDRIVYVACEAFSDRERLERECAALREVATTGEAADVARKASEP